MNKLQNITIGLMTAASTAFAQVEPAQDSTDYKIGDNARNIVTAALGVNAVNKDVDGSHVFSLNLARGAAAASIDADDPEMFKAMSDAQDNFQNMSAEEKAKLDQQAAPGFAESIASQAIDAAGDNPNLEAQDTTATDSTQTATDTVQVKEKKNGFFDKVIDKAKKRGGQETDKQAKKRTGRLGGVFDKIKKGVEEISGKGSDETLEDVREKVRTTQADVRKSKISRTMNEIVEDGIVTNAEFAQALIEIGHTNKYAISTDDFTASDLQEIDDLSVELLAQLGIDEPSKKEISGMTNFIIVTENDDYEIMPAAEFAAKQYPAPGQ